MGFVLKSVGAIVFLLSAGCGVRGKPEPPATPASLGRGQPSFRRATEEFAFPSVPSPDSRESNRDVTPDSATGSTETSYGSSSGYPANLQANPKTDPNTGDPTKFPHRDQGSGE